MLHQGRIEQYFLDFIHRSSQDVSIDRPVKPVKLDIDTSLVASEDEYPITVTLLAGDGVLVNGNGILNGAEKEPVGGETVVRCKYMIGCDGAHSWVREQLGIVMEGEQTESVWGVMDIIPITNFRENP